MLKQRILGGGIVAVIFALLVYFGAMPLLIGLFLISEIGLFEIYRVMDIHKVPLSIGGYIFIALMYVLVYYKNSDFFFPIVFALLYLIVLVIRFKKFQINVFLHAVVSVFYVGGFAIALYKVRSLPDGFYYAWLIFAASWGSDVAAYFAGRFLGKRHIFPVLSPKKTLEGCIGGIIGATLTGVVIAAVFHNSIPTAILLCAVGSVFSQLGDLAASAVKRKFDKKDYGSLIPGHGGIMDRFDSMLFVSAIFYIIQVIVQ